MMRYLFDILLLVTTVAGQLGHHETAFGLLHRLKCG